MRNNAFHSTYLEDRVGHTTITPATPCEAGSFASLTLIYTVGYFGIDDTGSLKIVHRSASDMGKMQFTDPAGWRRWATAPCTTRRISGRAVLTAGVRGRSVIEKILIHVGLQA